MPIVLSPHPALMTPKKVSTEQKNGTDCSEEKRNGKKVPRKKNGTTLRSENCLNLFGWDYTIVNDRKFLVGTIFFSHIKPVSSTSSRSATNKLSQTNRPELQTLPKLVRT